MAGPERGTASWLALALAGCLWLGCASGGTKDAASTADPVAEPEAASDSVEAASEAQSSAQAEPPPIEVTPQVTPEPEAALGESSDEVPPPTEPENETVVVIDPGAKDLTERPVSLVDAARAERQRRNMAEPTDIVITDKTLSDFATGELTVAEPTTDAALMEELSEAEKRRAEEEEYWRSGVRAIRQAWRDAYDRTEELEGKVFELRQQFYREDDGFYRDSEIKPAWDRAIDQLEEAREEVESRQQELIEFMEAGRKAGALPGWLREGIDLEPPPTIEEEASAEPSEPVIYEPEGSDSP